MGEVWAATNTATGRPVALKRLLHALDGHPGSQTRARFVLEARAACAVLHPNVVQVLDFVEGADEPPVIVMELLEGETLASKLAREHAMSLEETARVLLPVVSAVGTAHSRGIVHRDLKPANIFLSTGGETDPVVKVLDFGIAKWVAPPDEESPFRTQTGSTLGTPSYMAPEQATGERSIDHRADIWSLGIILYECLTGVRPVDGKNAAHVVSRLLSTGIIPIDRLAPTLPSDVTQLVGRMLTREVARRVDDLREVSRVLTPIARRPAPVFGQPRGDQKWRVGSPSPLPATAPPVSHVAPGDPPEVRRDIGPKPPGSERAGIPWLRTPWALAAGGIVATSVMLGAARSFRATPSAVAGPPPTTARTAARADAVVVAPVAFTASLASWLADGGMAAAPAAGVVGPVAPPRGAVAPSAPVAPPSPSSVARKPPATPSQALESAPGRHVGGTAGAPPVPSAKPFDPASIR